LIGGKLRNERQVSRYREAALDVPVREVTAEYACEMQAMKEQAARTIDELRRSAF
jgi:hypothetical protein